MNNKKITWKDLFNKYKDRGIKEISGVKSTSVKLETRAKDIIKQHKISITIISIIALILIIWTMYDNLLALLITLVFFAGVIGLSFLTDKFSFTCNDNGVNIKFGFQKGMFPYESIKAIYISKYTEFNLFHIFKNYSIVVKYEDLNGYIKDLTFSTMFLKPEDVDKFLSNFIVKEQTSTRLLNSNRFKLFQYIAKMVGILILAGIILYYVIISI